MKTLELNLLRFSGGKEDTIGILYVAGSPVCFILEDEYREEKVYAETRIPEGRYEVRFRQIGKWNERLASHKDSRIWAMHKGALEVIGVPNFEAILFHPGNTEKDTAGCLLPGRTARLNAGSRLGMVQESTEAYVELYPQIAEPLSSGVKVWITITDTDREIRSKFVETS